MAASDTQTKVKEKDVTEWIFKRFNELTKPNTTAQQREEILYRVFSMLGKCDKSWQCQLDILDVFGNIIKNKAEILFGCGNILDLVITMIENLENNSDGNNDININTIHCKLCHLISIVGRRSMSVKHLNRILILLRDSLLSRRSRFLAPLLLSTLKDMTSHSPPFYDNHQCSFEKKEKKQRVQRVHKAKKESIFGWLMQQEQKESIIMPQKKKKQKIKNNKLLIPNTLLHIIHQLPLSSFAFLNDRSKQCSIDIPMKYIKKWPYSNGFTFVCWVLYDQLLPHIYNKNSWMTLFSMLTVSGYGIHISLCCKSGSLKVRICGAKNVVDEQIIPKARLLASTWYFVAITHSLKRTATLRLLRPSHSNGQCKIYINGNKTASIDFEFVCINEKPKYCSIGRCSYPKHLNSKDSTTSSTFVGQFGSIYFFGNPLSSAQISQLYSFGANYMIKPEIVNNNSNGNWIFKNMIKPDQNNINVNAASLIENEIFSNLMFAYHPLATELSNKLCLNIGSSIFLHGKISGDVEIFKTRDVRNIFHCSIGGLLTLFPILNNVFSDQSTGTGIICEVFSLLAQLLHFSASNQVQMHRSNGIAILAYLLHQIKANQQTASLITPKVLAAIHNFCCHLSWLQCEHLINCKIYIDDENSLNTQLQFRSLSSSAQFNHIRADLVFDNYQCLFSQSVNYLILNFKIWAGGPDPNLDQQLVEMVTVWCCQQPQYMYQLIHLGFLLNEISIYYPASAINWNHRQRWFSIVIHLIKHNLNLNLNHQRHSSSLQYIDLLLQMAVELTDPLESSDMMEMIVSLILSRDDLVLSHLSDKKCLSLFCVLFREQCTHGDKAYLQVCCLHLINALNLIAQEGDIFVLSLVSSFFDSAHSIALVTYHAFLELILFQQPGSIGAQHGTEWYVKKHELIQSKHYVDALKNSFIKYPQSLIQLLRCYDKDVDDVKHLKSILEDFISLLATSLYSKENASAIVASRGFQEPFIKLIDFSNIHLQSDTNSLSWYGETCLDLLLQYSLLYDNRGWKIVRDTFRIMRYYCEHSKISLIYCVLSQCYLFIRILKRLSSLIHTNEAINTDIIIVNLVRCLELIEILIYELPPGLFSYKIDDWVLMGDDEDERESKTNIDLNQVKQLIPTEIMDEVWLLLCSSIVSVIESIPKCNLSPSLYKDISSPPLKTGSPFRVLLRLLLSCCERNIGYAGKQTAKIVSLIQNSLQFLSLEQHPSITYIGSLSFVVRRFHGEEINNQFTIFLVKSLHDLYGQCTICTSKQYLLKLIEFVIKSREPISFIPIDMFNGITDNNLYLTCKVNNGEMFAILISQAKAQKLTHLAIPITSKLLSSAGLLKNDMGFALNKVRLQFTSNNAAKNKKMEIMIMERVQSDIRANLKFIQNLNFINFEKGNVEVLESNAIRKLLEKMDNKQRNYLEYYRNQMLSKEQGTLNKYAYTEANRKVFSLNQSDEKLKRGKVYWLECKPHIYCQGSVWFKSVEKKRTFWQIDSWENRHRMRLKLMEYKGGLIKTRSAGDSHSSLLESNKLSQSIAHLDEWGIKLHNSDIYNSEEDEGEEDKEDEWDYCDTDTVAVEDDMMVIYECGKDEGIQLITAIGNYGGTIKLTNKYWQFMCSSPGMRSDHFSLPALNKIRVEESRDRYISLSKIHAIFRRRYQLQHSALEIYLLDGKSYFFDVGSKQKRNEILKILFSNSELKSSLCNINRLFSRKTSDILAQSCICQRWRMGQISNFDYLMLLNTISGRTYNDVNQYPIFPWILCDYVSPFLDLSNPSVFRDLSKPMGALNPDRLKTIIKKYKGLLEDTSVPAFHYGSHYSNGAIVISYLLRLEPFSSLHIELQGGKFDFPDRLFNSLQQSWDAVISSLTTFKELIPELYFMPHILKNVNCYDFGTRQNGEQVDDVKLPPWAKDCYDFIRKHKAALESPYVSANLHHWIDLIWGYKQRGKPAEAANNLYYHLTYEGAVKLDEMEDQILKRAMKEQIANFGQTPIQLFHKPHIEREPCANDYYQIHYRSIYQIGNKYQKIPSLHEVIVNKQTAIQTLFILDNTEHNDYERNLLITVSVLGMPLGHTLYLEKHKNTLNHFNADSKLKIRIPSVVRDLYTYRTPPLQYDTPSFVLFEHSHSSKYHPSSLTKATQHCIAFNDHGHIVYVGNNWDSSLRVYRLEHTTNTSNINSAPSKQSKKHKPHLGCIKWRLVQSFISHKSRIACIDTDGIHLASGSDDCTVVIWQINNKYKHKHTHTHFAFDLLLNHGKRDKTTKLKNELDMAHENGKESHLSNIGLISDSKCVLRGHQSPIVAIALNSELDICVSCSSQGIILVHTVQYGEYRHSLYISSEICGRGTAVNSLQFEHIPGRDRHVHSSPKKNEPHPDVKYNPFDVTSSSDPHSDSDSDSDMDIEADSDREEKACERCQIDLVRISANGTVVFLSKTNNMIFTCNINGMNWHSLKVTDNLTSIHIDRSGKLLLTAGQCGIAKIRFIHNLSQTVYKFMPVGDSITFAKFDNQNNRVYICTESGNLHLFALPHLTRTRAIVDTLN